MKYILTIAFVAAVMVSIVEAEVSYIFLEKNNGVEISYSGKLDTSAFAFQGATSSDLKYIEIPAANITLCDIQNYQEVSFVFSADDVTFSWNLDPLPLRYYATSSSGETFGINVFDYVGSYRAVINVPPGYVSGSPFSGDMFFEGENFLSMGIRANGDFQIYLPGGETISGAVVPEPDFLKLFVLGLFGATGVHHYGSRQRSRHWKQASSGLALI